MGGSGFNGDTMISSIHLGPPHACALHVHMCAHVCKSHIHMGARTNRIIRLTFKVTLSNHFQDAYITKKPVIENIKH